MTAVQALLLFGSHARGDSQRDSDLDILAVVEKAPIHPFEKENLSVSFYSEKFLLKISSVGNLFALHLIEEARPIFDPINILGRMRSSFQKKDNYSKEIADASLLGWFLIRHSGKVRKWNLYNKRVAWCVRTIIIAKAFTEGVVIFSSQELFAFSKSEAALWLIKNKNSQSFDEKTLFRFARFLENFGLGDPGVYNIDDINSHIGYIFRSNNIIGKNTIASLFQEAADSYMLPINI